MAEHSRFFNSQEGDIREYQAAEFAEYFSRFLSDGVYVGTNAISLKVSSSAGMNVSIGAGYAFVRGYMYKNDSPLIKTLEPSDATLDRIDRIVIKFDEINRTIAIEIKKGIFSSQPIAPALMNTDTEKELSLARIRIGKGTTTILASAITDERLSEFCGPVSGLITLPIDDMWSAWNNELADIEQAWINKKANVDTDWGAIETNWNAWFASVQNTLGLRVMVGTTEPLELAINDIWIKLHGDGTITLYQKKSGGVVELQLLDVKNILSDVNNISSDVNNILSDVNNISSKFKISNNPPNSTEIAAMQEGDFWFVCE